MKCLINYGEIHYGNVPNRPDQFGIIIPGKRGKLLATLYTAGGKGKYPLILLLHGIPGNEQNLDLAQALRRDGFHVLIFHYSGSWGSEGNYALKHNLEDAETVLEYMLQEERFNINKNLIYAIGHSLGGFVCGQLSAKRKEIRACALLMPCDIGRYYKIQEENPIAGETLSFILGESTNWLQGVTKEQFLEEIRENTKSFPLEAAAKMLVQKPVLCIEASLDDQTPPSCHCHPFGAKILSEGGTQFEVHSLETDHSASDYRLELISIVTNFFGGLISKEDLGYH